MDEMEARVSGARSRADRWASVNVLAQATENADTVAESQLKWSKIYRLFDATGETAQDEVFAAVNMYFLFNGASPSGKYSKPIKTAGGAEVSAGEVVKITGRLDGDIRQFLRGRLGDSYNFLKHNPAIKNDETLAAKAENAGVQRSLCWLQADWLGADCQYFVSNEADVYGKLRASKIALAQVKAAHALPAVDRVRDMAPEARAMRPATPRAEYAPQDLF